MNTLKTIADKVSFDKLYAYTSTQDKPPGRKLLEIALKSFRNRKNIQAITGLELCITQPQGDNSNVNCINAYGLQGDDSNENCINIYCVQTEDKISEDLPLIYDVYTQVGTGKPVIGLELLLIEQFSRLIVSSETLGKLSPVAIMALSINAYRLPA